MLMSNKKIEGEFYTPELFANFAHKILEKHFGKNWYNEYYVWDPAWGIGNLTKSKKFKHLYASTLHQSDIDASDANKEAEKFQFDFLNDPIKSLFGLHIPQGLYDALTNNKPIIFLMNPPYAAPNDFKDGFKDVSINTYTQSFMGDMKYAKQNLFSQFLYRIMMLKNSYNLTNCNICVFSSSVFMSGSGYEKFRKSFLESFHFIDGYLFDASYFDECSKRWGISLSVWKSGEGENKHDFKHHLIDVKNGKVEITGSKIIYNIDGENSFRNFCKEALRGKKTYPTITLKNPVTVGTKDGSMMTTDAIGFYVNASNNVYKSLQQCYFLSTAPDNVLSGFSVTKENFLPVCANFASRKVITNNWINNKDEFLAPVITEENHELWAEFISDSIVYSMFNAASCQSAMQPVSWKGYDYKIKNAFFFMGRKEMMELAGTYEYYDMIKTTFDDEDRYAYELLEGKVGEKLSNEGKAVLDYARNLLSDSMKDRSSFNTEYPELNIMCWDAGYYQLRPLWKQYYPERLKEFRALYKRLANKLRKQVYELRILK
jgi:hypothetical protein